MAVRYLIHTISSCFVRRVTTEKQHNRGRGALAETLRGVGQKSEILPIHRTAPPLIERFFLPMTEKSQPLDLLGDPIPEAMDRRGRPGFEVTDEKRIKVKGLSAMGHNQDFIAKAIGCCEKTLRNYFILELEEGAALVTGDVFFKLYQRGVEEGNVTALGKLAVLLAPRDPETDPGDGPAKPSAKPPKLGKKQQDERDASTAHEGTEWDGLLH